MKHLMSLLAAIYLCLPAHSQQVTQIRSVEKIAMGDGTYTFRDFDTKKHLEGNHRLIMDDREYVLASFSNGLPHGSWETYRYNKLKEKKNYLMGRLDGALIEYYGDGTTPCKEAMMKNGKMHGRWVEYYTNGNIAKDEFYQDGLEHGRQTAFNHDGTLKRDCFFKNGKPEGKQKNLYRSNTGDFWQESNCKNGIRQGQFTETFLNGNLKTKGEYLDGEKNGVWIVNYENGRPKSYQTYKKGKRNGDSKTFFDDGNVQSITPYVNDLKEGIAREFFETTKTLKAEISYVANYEHGSYKFFYDNGKLLEEGHTERGYRIYAKEYFINGQLRSVKEQKDGVWETTERYDQSGKQL